MPRFAWVVPFRASVPSSLHPSLIRPSRGTYSRPKVVSQTNPNKPTNPSPATVGPPSPESTPSRPKKSSHFCFDLGAGCGRMFGCCGPGAGFIGTRSLSGLPGGPCGTTTKLAVQSPIGRFPKARSTPPGLFFSRRRRGARLGRRPIGGVDREVGEVLPQGGGGETDHQVSVDDGKGRTLQPEVQVPHSVRVVPQA